MQWAWALSLVVLVVAVSAACSHREPARPPLPSPESEPTSAPNLAPVVTLAGPVTVHEGFEVSWTGSAIDPEGELSAVVVDFGDDNESYVASSFDGSFRVSHRFATDGVHVVSVTARDAEGHVSTESLAIETIPRKVVFVGGIQSESSCQGALAPAWMRALIGGVELTGYMTFGALDVLSYSYSGRYCDGGTGANGADADYRSSDTCDGVAVAAARLKAIIDAAAPSRVTVVGHSLGGLVATYLAGNEPSWAMQHIASIVTFDSPLQGVPRMNLEVLRLSSVDGGCAWNSPSLADLGDGSNAILKVAAAAPGIVPVYTVDATDKEGPFGGIRQAVPGGRTHLDGEAAAFTVSMGHSASWWKEAESAEDRRSQRLALACGIAVLAPSTCLAEPW